MHNRHDEPPHIPDFTPIPTHDRPFWRRAHLDWRVWVAVVFISVALFVYITTVDLSIMPRSH